ncbi:MAG: preprotein translocase subunit SecA [Planctomycetales bacterium]|nr:preprotein translocase subunit SecA [Planctomycetales bacterium]
MLKGVTNGRATWHLTNWKRNLLPKIDSFRSQLQQERDDQLRKRSLSLRFRFKSGEPAVDLLPEAYALVREAARRTLSMEHYDVQMLGGIAMFFGMLAEMETGEGKTLTATLPMYLRALAGKGCHLTTVNDYLAKRDADQMGPLYKLLGLSTGCVQTQMSQPERRKNYACDITYGTAKEFGFDFLRDRLLMRENGMLNEDSPSRFLADASPLAGERPVQRGHYFALVDEADSVLIDEARTPLIISAIPGEAEKIAAATYDWAAKAVEQFEEDEHYEYDHEKKTVELNMLGRQLVRSLPKSDLLDTVGFIDMYEHIERAIKVDREFERDREYVIRDGEIVIVDESTGRLAEGRKWRSGIHQAVEAREGLEVTVDTGQAARVTVQDFFLRYQHLGGMTGTAITSAAEMKKIYKLTVVQVPTNRPVQRKRLPDRVFGSAEEKWNAIVQEILEMHEQGRPVLIGTRSISRSELLSALLTKAGIHHEVLNANRIELEAEIVSEAGQQGKVTVSTNMAGRGTDIKLGVGVADLGGLHVIGTELHDSARIDRQLYGRCGRQGDPGTVRQFLALDDDVMEHGFGPKKAEKLESTGSKGGSFSRYASLFKKAQDKVERRHFQGRKMLLHHEKAIRKMQLEMGQDPYLDKPD